MYKVSKITNISLLIIRRQQSGFVSTHAVKTKPDYIMVIF